MKNILLLLSILLLILDASGAALAAEHDHSSHASGMSMPAATPSTIHEGMQMGGAMIMLESVTVDGIAAMAHLQDLRQGAAQPIAGATHNFMVSFTDDKGAAVAKGRAAVKITGPDVKTGDAITLNPKDGFFRGSIKLKKPGKYTLVVGTKLTDDKARQFGFTYELK